MRYFAPILIFIAIFAILEPVYFEEYDQEDELLIQVRKYDVKPPLLPRVILRKYMENYRFPQNFSYSYNSIPVEVTHIKNDLFQLSSEYRQTNNKISSVRLWLEFPNIRKSKELQNREFIMEITPVIGTQDMTKYTDYCSTLILVSRSRFPDGIMEIKFDITTIYKACKAIDVQPEFRYKVLFYPVDDRIDINLKKYKVEMYLIFKELEEDENEIDFDATSDYNYLNYENIIRSLPQLRSLRSRRRRPRPCALRPFVFHFHESGWHDYIVQPHSYPLYKCHGMCTFPMRQNLNYTNYAVIKSVAATQYRNINSPSCIAQELKSLLMVVKEKTGKYNLKRKSDMIVTSCKCA